MNGIPQWTRGRRRVHMMRGHQTGLTFISFLCENYKGLKLHAGWVSWPLLLFLLFVRCELSLSTWTGSSLRLNHGFMWSLLSAYKFKKMMQGGYWLVTYLYLFCCQERQQGFGAGCNISWRQTSTKCFCFFFKLAPRWWLSTLKFGGVGSVTHPARYRTVVISFSTQFFTHHRTGETLAKRNMKKESTDLSKISVRALYHKAEHSSLNSNNSPWDEDENVHWGFMCHGMEILKILCKAFSPWTEHVNGSPPHPFKCWCRFLQKENGEIPRKEIKWRYL